MPKRSALLSDIQTPAVPNMEWRATEFDLGDRNTDADADSTGGSSPADVTDITNHRDFRFIAAADRSDAEPADDIAASADDAFVFQSTAAPEIATIDTKHTLDALDALAAAAPNLVPSSDAAFGSAGAAAQGGFGGRFVWRGPQEITITHDGVERSFVVDVPKSYNPSDASQSFSAVLAFHGGVGGAINIMGASKFSDAGNVRDFVAVYPNAYADQWNDGRETTDSGIDDIGFVEAIIQQLADNWSVDTGRLFAAGISNGGMFVQRLATETPDLFQGYGVVSANLPTTLENNALSDVDEPMVFFNSTEDRYMPFEGGRVIGGFNGVGAGGDVLGSLATADYWADQNDTEMGVFEQMPDIADDGMTTAYRMSDDGTIHQYVTYGGDHQWPGLDPSSGYGNAATQDINASDIILDFFEEYGL